MFTPKLWSALFFGSLLVVVVVLGLFASRRLLLPVQALDSDILSQSPPQVAGCDLFPADNIWNTPIDTLSVHPDSNTYINTISADKTLHPDFGAGLWEGGPIGIPFVDVADDQPRVAVSFTYDNESDPGPYPIPTNAPIEGGANSDGDRHVLVVDRETCRLYELFNAFPQEDGSWDADSGAIFDLNAHALRPAGWTSADAAGLPILPGLVRYDEVAAGEIRHALRFTVPQTRRAYIWPARHFASSLTDSKYPPMGLRLRLKADFDISGYAPQTQVILTALKRYGMILADNGSAWYISGAPDERWDNNMLRQLKGISGANFEAVDVSSLMVDPDSGRVRGATSQIYLPSVRKGQAAPLSTTTPTATATASTTSTPTATPSATPTASATPSATPTATGSPTVIDVDLFVDDDNTSGTENGSAQRPYNTVQEAINAAAAGQTIGVAAGIYAQNLRIMDKTVHLYGGYVGGTAADYAGGSGGNFSSRNPTANVSHLQGNGADSTLTLVEAGSSTVDGFRITGGTRSLLPEYGIVGGGFYISGGAPTISRNLIENNDTRPAGQPLDSEPVGGGIFAQDANISILNNVIRNNASGRGAGIGVSGGDVVIRGNTVQDNIGVSDHGGGLYLAAPKLTVSHNRIIGNEIGRALGYGWGGGIIVFSAESRATLAYNTITGNYAPSVGSGVFIDDGAQATLDHELIYANVCPDGGTTGGVGVYVDGYAETGSLVTMIQTTVAGHNCATQGGNGLYVEAYSGVTIRNSIFWGNGGDDFFVDATSQITATYTLSQEALPGTGNLSVDPLFADAANHDYHLRSTGGRWNPTTAQWVVDSQHSSAIDAADPASPFAQEPTPNGDRANLGVYGNTAEASKAKSD
ncbi:MAG: right-handed parallel beta-helix repeat-containing protein [Caldilineaceae bacterium]|nr:right-handed parallel beta-helix repeat-containing protein [Caldilineaceae bacterium]